MMDEDLQREIEDLHAERCSLLESFCQFLADLFGDEEEEKPAD